jgi:hypothetical protein
MMGLSLTLNRIGVPSTLVVIALAEALGSDSPFFPIVYLLLLLAILFNWAVFGMVGGLVFAAWRRTRAI